MFTLLFATAVQCYTSTPNRKLFDRNTHRYLAVKSKEWHANENHQQRNETIWQKKVLDIFGYRWLARCEWVAVENHNAHTALILYHSLVLFFSYTRICKIAEQHFMAGLFRHMRQTTTTTWAVSVLFRLQNANGNNIKYMH